MLVRHALAAALLLGAGCFSTPGFSGARDGGGDDDDDDGGSGSDARPFGDEPEVHFELDDVKEMIVGPNMRFRFTNTNWQMPDSLRTRTLNNEWLSFTNFDYYEQGIGVSFPDAQPNRYIVGPRFARTGAPLTFEMPELGPARAKVKITWGGPAPCSGDGSLTGNITEFAVYPDGRIARHDEVVAANTATGCDRTVGVFHSYLGTDRGVYRSYNGATSMDPHAIPTAGIPTDKSMPSDIGFACLEDEDAALGMTWTNPGAANWSFFEVGRSPDNYIAFNYMINEEEMLTPAKRYVANTMTALRKLGCVDMGELVMKPYWEPSTVTNAAWRASDAAYVLDGTGTSVTTSGEIPAGSAFVIPSHPSIASVKINGAALAATHDYVTQTVGSDGLVWIGVKLPAAATVEFEAASQ